MTDKNQTSREKTGVLLLNLGSPSAPNAEALKPYLEEFLSDRYVIDYPRWLWMPVLKGIILKTRPEKSAALYANIWTENGSPLVYLSESIARKLGARLRAGTEEGITVRVGMRYGQPAIPERLTELVAADISRLVILPLFPQYSTTTTQTALDAAFEALHAARPELPVEVIQEYHDHPAYIKVLAESILEDWAEHGKPEKLLLSFHGVPKRYCRFDPYAAQCKHTAALLAERLGLNELQWAYAFQSHFGPEPWVKPYTEQVLADWGRAGVKSVSVCAPGFAVDCLETLDELAREAKMLFVEAGGKTFRYIPALNDTYHQIQLLETLLRERAGIGSE